MGERRSSRPTFGENETLPSAAAECDAACHGADLALVRAVLAGDREANEQLQRRLDFVTTATHRLLRQRGSGFDPNDAEDLAQDVYLALWSRLEAYDGRRRLEAWAQGFCWRQLLSFRAELGRRARTRLGANADEPTSTASAEPELDSDERALLNRALAALSSSVADVLRLRFLEGLSFASTAKRLGLPLGTVKSRYYRGLDAVRVRLGCPEQGRPTARPQPRSRVEEKRAGESSAAAHSRSRARTMRSPSSMASSTSPPSRSRPNSV